MTTHPDGQEGGNPPGAPRASFVPRRIAVPRIPGIHRPYLVAMAVTGAIGAAVPFVRQDETIATTLLFLEPAAGLLHFAWLWVVFRDARQVLGPGHALDPSRLLVFALLACALTRIWNALALVLLCRAAWRRASARDPSEGRDLGRIAAEASGLLAAAILASVVSLVTTSEHLARTSLYGADARVALSTRDVFGLTGAIAISLFGVAVAAYYVVFLARAVPVLYRSFAAQARAENAAAAPCAGPET